MKPDITAPNFLASQGKVSSSPSIQTYLITIAWLVIGLPLFFIAAPFAGLNLLYKKFTTKKRKPSDVKQYPIYQADNNIQYDQRPYDLVVFGATGFTGSLAVNYIVEHYRTAPFKWAIAGRNKSALERVLSEALTAIEDIS